MLMRCHNYLLKMKTWEFKVRKNRKWYFHLSWSCHTFWSIFRIVLVVSYCGGCGSVSCGAARSAVANLAPTLVIFIFTFCPTFAFFTKITKPWTLAMPSPCLLVSVICTSYSLPVSTGFGPKLPPPERLPPPYLVPYDISQYTLSQLAI